MFAPQTWIGPPAEAGPRSAPFASDHAEDERCVRGFGSAAERARILAWLCAGLRPGRPGRLEREYPACFGPASRALPIVAWAAAEPAAFCLLLPTRFALARGSLRTGLISLVYTDPRFRGRGLARRVVARALAEARSAHIGLCMLWSEPALGDFYASQGFTRAGNETLLAFDANTLSAALAEGSGPDSLPALPLEIDSARESDWPSIAAIRSARTCHATLAGHGADWLGIPDLEIRVARRANSVVGFAMHGRGDDFPGVVHEWGGESEAVLRCCANLLAPGGEAGLLLLSPRETSALTWRLRRSGARLVRGPLAWMQVACAAALAEDLASVVPELSHITLTAPETDASGGPRLRVANTQAGTACELAACDWLEAVFGAGDAGSGAKTCPALAAVLPPAAAAKLPLPFFVWGLESI